MTWMRGLWAGATLLLALSGCSKGGDDKVKGGGVYSPIITGIASSKEPAVRDVANELTVLVTNVNNYPITYHWSAGAGDLTDSTGATATWVAPNAIGIYPVTVSIEARDDAANVNFFKSTTFQIYVDNEYVRWTTSPEVQFDPAPAPTPPGGVLFAQFRNISTGETDVYHVPAEGLSPEQLTQNFFLAKSPTMRFDGQQIAFAARKRSTDSLEIWVLPAAGGDTSAAIPGELISDVRKRIANPRYARTGNWCLFNSEETSIPNMRPWFGTLVTQPERVLSSGGPVTFWMPNWGRDITGDDLPDSVVCQSFRFFGETNQTSFGLFKFGTRPEQEAGLEWLADFTASEPDWSPDGQHIIYTKPNPGTKDRDIWIISSVSTDPNAAIRVTAGLADDSHPRFSHDGSSIYFVSNRADRYGLNGIYTTERRGTNIWSVSGFDRP